MVIALLAVVFVCIGFTQGQYSYSCGGYDGQRFQSRSVCNIICVNCYCEPQQFNGQAIWFVLMSLCESNSIQTAKLIKRMTSNKNNK
jgi:hypothetical protein